MIRYVLLLLMISNTAVAALPLESLANIRSTAQAFALAQAQADDQDTAVQVGRIDPRLRLPRCELPLQAQLSAGARSVGRTTINVRCDGIRAWSLYVPVQVSVFRDVVTLGRNVNRQDLIATADLKLVRRDIGTLNSGFFTSIDEAADLIARRPLSTGAVLTPANTERPKLVKRGEQVRIAANKRGINVNAIGKALRDGRFGERIPVRNLRSDRTIEATVTARGSVEIRLD